LSPDRATTAPAAPIYLLHGREDTVIPAVESVMLGEYLRARRTPVRLLLTPLITHAEVDHAAAASDVWDLVRFWAEVLGK
jgi:predicted esterase